MIAKIFRALAQTTAGIWLGSIIAMAIVAPTTFRVARETGIDRPNYIAGRIMARNFSHFDKLQAICAALLVIWHIAELAGKTRTTRLWLQSAITLSAAAMLGYSALVLTPQILNLQETVAGADADAATRAAFDTFHQTSVLIAKMNLGLVFLLSLLISWPQKPSLPGGSGQ